jgi:CRP/FNR family cyclic AMP-dependent transcriptional regulator
MTADDLTPFLAEHSILQGLTPAQLVLVASRAKLAHYRSQQRVFTFGTRADKFYIIRSGKVGIEIPAIDGAPLTIQTVTDGSVLGWSWLMPPYRWLFDARALEASDIVVFDGDQIRADCEQDPRLGYELMKRFAMLMAERLNAAREMAIRHYTG